MGNEWDGQGGSFAKISRATEVVTKTILSGAAVSDAVDFRGYSGAVLEIPAQMDACNLGIKYCDSVGGTYKTLRKPDGGPVELTGIKTAEACGYALPSEVFACHFIKIWSKSTTAETNVNQSADRSLKIELKG